MDIMRVFQAVAIKNQCQLKLKKLLSSSIVIDWSNAHKSMLVCVFVSVMCLSFLPYQYVVLSNPQCYRYIDINVFYQFVHFSLLGSFLGLVIALFFYFLRHKPWADRYMPVLSVGYFAIATCFAGFITGAMGLALGVFLIGSPFIGFALFSTRMVSFAVGLATILMLVLAYLGVAGLIPYAPVFTDLFFNTQAHSVFYFYTQMSIVIPPSIFLFFMANIILKQ